MPESKPDGSDMRSKLTTWVRRKMPEAKRLSISEPEKPGMGLSSETYLFDVQWEEAGEQRSKGVVLRAAPADFKVFPDYELAHQFRIMDILRETDVPVAKMLWMEADPSIIGAPFFLMERLYGEVPQDFPSYHGSGMFFEATPEMRAKMWWGSLEAMARIHMLDWKSLGLSFSRGNRGAGRTRSIGNWRTGTAFSRG